MEILFRNAQRKFKIDRHCLLRLIENALGDLAPPNSEISIILVNDDKIRKLNKEYRGKDKPTDVLAFPQDEEALGDKGGRLLGDVVVSVETARRQAREHFLSDEEELILLVVHGALHLLGYDHDRSIKDKKKMQKITKKIFSRIFPGRQPSGSSEF